MTTPAPIRLCVGGTNGTLAVKEFADMAALADYMISAPYPKAPDNILADKEAKGNWKKWTLDCVTSVREPGIRNGLVAIHRNRTYSKEIGTQILIEDFDGITAEQAAMLPDMAAQFGAECFVIDSPTTQDHLGIYKRKVFTLLDRVANEAEYLHIWKQRAAHWAMFGMTSDPAQSHSHQMCYRPGNGARVWARPGAPLAVPADCPPMPTRDRIELGEGGESEPLGDLLPLLIERFRDGPPAPASGANGFDEVIRPVMFGLGADVLRASDLTDEARAELEEAVDHWLRDRDNIDECWRAAENGNGETTRGTVLHLLEIRTAAALPEFGAQSVPEIVQLPYEPEQFDWESMFERWDPEQEPTTRRCVIPGILEAGCVTLAGERGKGKSTLVSALVGHALDARRIPGVDPVVKPWKVIVLAEGVGQYAAIMRASGIALNNPGLELRKTRRMQAAVLEKVLAGIRKTRGERVWIILDTFNASLEMENTNDDGEAGRMMSVINQSKMAVTVIGHSTKASQEKDWTLQTMRGSGAIEGDAEQCLVFGSDAESGLSYLYQSKDRGNKRKQTEFETQQVSCMLWDEESESHVQEQVRIIAGVKGAPAAADAPADEPAGERQGQPMSLTSRKSPFRGAAGLHDAKRMLKHLSNYIGDTMRKTGNCELTEDAIRHELGNVKTGTTLQAEWNSRMKTFMGFFLNESNGYVKAVVGSTTNVAPTAAYLTDCLGESTAQQLHDMTQGLSNCDHEIRDNDSGGTLSD